MKEIILSYDYELFFGYNSGTVRRSIIEPTNLLLDRLDNCGFKANFFIDFLMIKALRQEKDTVARNDLISIENQIRDIVKRGHRIELHIHPHWVDAKYVGDGKWDFSNYDHYCIHSLPASDIRDMFTEGCKILKEIIEPIDGNYRIVAYRAGGWAIQPFDKIKNAMVVNDIIIDSSAARKVFSLTGYSKCDFRFIPIEDYYHFEDDISQPVEKGNFIEVPISTYRRNTIHRILDHGYGLLFPSKLKKYADGTHQLKQEKLSPERPSKRHRKYAMVTLSQRCFLTVLSNLFFTKRKLLVFIDHPKDFTYSALENLWFLSKFTKSILYKDIIDK